MTNRCTKQRIVFLLSALLPLTMVAAERSASEAAVLAAQFMNENTSSSRREAALSSSSFVLSHTRAKLNSEAPAFYVFNKTSEGFVVVSADDRTEDVLMYSEEGQLDVENINPNLKFWLGRLQEEISAANDDNTYSSAEKKARKAATATAISPLLVNDKGQEITWYQEAPYYNQCPKDGSKYSLTGCVATATAQIMYKWRYPEKGTGSHSYTSDSKRLYVSQDFSAVTFDWDNMLPSYDGVSATTAQKNAVAWLMRCCGVACDMDYANDGSGAWTDDMAYGLITYFGYTIDRFISTYSKSSYRNTKGTIANVNSEWSVSSTNFTKYFNADLEAGRPIVMGGEDSDGGHEFVCDGRDANGKFHINWGWEGDGNCYCALTSLKPTGTSYNFSSNIDAIIGLQPTVTDTVYVSGITVTPATATLKINQTVALSANITPSNATIQTVTWSCDNQKVASVTSSGVVTGVGAGTAKITATTKDGGKTAFATITVTNEVAPKETFKWVTDASQLKAGDEIILVATYKQVHYAMDNNLTPGSRSKYFGVEKETIKDSTITLEEGSQACVLTLGGSKDNWTLTEATNGQLGATAAKKVAWKEGTQTWKISIDNNHAATVQSTTSSYGKILYNDNNGEPRFTTYANTNSTMLLPEIFARSTTQKDTVIKVTGVSLGQNTATIKEGETVQLYVNITPATATNQNVVWTTSQASVATVDDNGLVTAITKGETTITLTTVDGNYQATCLITVLDAGTTPNDTVYVLASEAKQIGINLGKGNTSTQFYGVKGYVTMPNSQEYNGFYIDDQYTTNTTFQGYNCKMPSGVIALTEGQYICVYGYIMNYNNQKMQIKDGEVVILDTPSSRLEENNQTTSATPRSKFIIGGQLYIQRGERLYNVLGQYVR